MVTAAQPEAATIRLADLNLDETIQLREELNEDAISRYEQILNVLPPNTVVATETHGNLVADGYHRVTAAVRQGRPSIRATTTPGTYESAWEVAIQSNLSHGVPLTWREREQAVLHLAESGMSQRAIARLMGITQQTVTDICRRGRIANEVGIPVNTETARAISRVPETYRRPLAETVGHTRPDRNEANARANTIRRLHETGDETGAMEVARGTRSPEGEALINVTQANAQIRQAAREAPGTRFEFALAALNGLPEFETFLPTLVALDAGDAGRNVLDSSIHRAITYLRHAQDVINAPGRIVN
jgi:ParB-like chromosome segregation protein Spo0J